MNELIEYAGCDGLLNIGTVEIRFQMVQRIIQLYDNGSNGWAKAWDRLCNSLLRDLPAVKR